MQSYSIDHYAARREECLAAAAATKLENARKRQLDAAEAWQQIIDRLGSGNDRTSVPSPG